MSATDEQISPPGSKRRCRKKGLPGPTVPREDTGYLDRIARAIEREREHARVGVPEREAVWARAFRCVCCGRLRGDQERREPRSEVCMRCVHEAGYLN